MIESRNESELGLSTHLDSLSNSLGSAFSDRFIHSLKSHKSQADRSLSQKSQHDRSQGKSRADMGQGKSQADKSQSNQSESNTSQADQSQPNTSQADKSQPNTSQVDTSQADRNSEKLNGLGIDHGDHGVTDNGITDNGDIERDETDEDEDNRMFVHSRELSASTQDLRSIRLTDALDDSVEEIELHSTNGDSVESPPESYTEEVPAVDNDGAKEASTKQFLQVPQATPNEVYYSDPKAEDMYSSDSTSKTDFEQQYISTPLERQQHVSFAPAPVECHSAEFIQRDRKKNKKKRRYSPPISRIVSSTGLIIHIGQEIGCGAYSRCYLAQSEYGQVFAAKIVFNNKRSSKPLATAVDEINIHKSMHHPHIVEFYEYMVKESFTLMLLEYCPNNNMQEYVKNRGRLTECEACYFMFPIAGAVEYLHSQYVHHGDIKLSNVLLDEYMQPKVADLGFARRLGPNQARTKVCGTPGYMAPEMLVKPVCFGLPSDIWALGITAYAMLYGRTPFESSSLSRVYNRILAHDLHMEVLDANLSFAAISFIEMALTPDPFMRPTISALSRSPWLRLARLGHVSLPTQNSHTGDMWTDGSAEGKRPRLRGAVKDFIGRKLRMRKLNKSADHIAGL